MRKENLIDLIKTEIKDSELTDENRINGYLPVEVVDNEREVYLYLYYDLSVCRDSCPSLVLNAELYKAKAVEFDVLDCATGETVFEYDVMEVVSDECDKFFESIKVINRIKVF